MWCSAAATVLASGASGGAGNITPGQKVKVKAPVTVYHVPKTKGAATPLQGLHGVVTAIADKHTDGSQLSCTMPLKVRSLVLVCGTGGPSCPDPCRVYVLVPLTRLVRPQVELSVNAPDGKPVTFTTHLTADEVELV